MSREEGFGIGSKIKKLFSSTKSAAPSAPSRRSTLKGIIIKPSLIKDISSESPPAHRIKGLRELSERVQAQELEESAAEALLVAIKDLLESQASRDETHAALTFVAALVKGQAYALTSLREYIFLLVKNRMSPEDLPLCLDVLIALTDHGRNLTHIETQIGALLVSWQKTFALFERKSDFLNLVINVIKFNAAYLDEEKTIELLRDTCHICTKTKSEDDVKLCLQIIESVLCYSYLPGGSLSHVTTTLCQLLAVKSLCDAAWKLMKKVLGTHLGHAAIFALCSILLDRGWQMRHQELVVRGAVYMLSMALWSSERVLALKHSAAAVLPSLLKALECNSAIVSYEVAEAILRLLRRFGKNQPVIVWDLVLDIVEALFEQVEKQSSSAFASLDGNKVKAHVHDILSAVEDLHENGYFIDGSGSGGERLFALIEKHVTVRPENSVLALLCHRAQSCHPFEKGWLVNLTHLMERYFSCETRVSIRLKALEVLSQIVSSNKALFEDEMITTVILEQLSTVDTEDAVAIRAGAVVLLVDLAKTCSSPRCLDLLELINKVLNCPRTAAPSAAATDLEHGEPELKDIYCGVTGLIEIFMYKLPTPAVDHLLAVYRMLVDQVLNQYRSPLSGCESHYRVRAGVFSLLLDLRADGNGRVGLLMQEHGGRLSQHSVRYSPHCLVIAAALAISPVPVAVTGVPGVSWVSIGGDTEPSFSSVTAAEKPLPVFQFSTTLDAILECLRKESDWRVLSMVLDKMATQWQNKALVLSASSRPSSTTGSSMNNYVEKICVALCELVGQNTQKYFERLTNRPCGLSCSDFHSAIFPVLTCMASYHMMLSIARQNDMIKCLEFGLVSKNARTCVTTLRVCAMEMESTMARLLPSILQCMRRIAATKAMAVTILTFLSSLVKLPKLYKNFNEQQYKLVFAIALAYTDPSRFPHFAVYLAHHVIAMWFVKCRLTYRRLFVSFIIQGLKSNVLQQFEDKSRTTVAAVSDEPGRGTATNRLSSGSSAANVADEKMSLFHSELAETCADMMSRYVYATCSTVPKRTPVSEFLLEGGQSQTWLLANKLVTITTSGGGSKATKSGLCSKCTAAAAGRTAASSEVGSGVRGGRSRRRHKSAIGAAKDSPQARTSGAGQSSHDDLDLHRRTSTDLDIGELESKDNAEQDVFLGLGKASLASGSQRTFNPGVCNCWCNGWVEIHIRRPSGSVSWIMRIQNQQLFSCNDSTLADICSLFMPSPSKGAPGGMQSCADARIDSDSLEDNEYASLHAEHFGSSTGGIGRPVAPSASRRASVAFFDEWNGPSNAPLSPLLAPDSGVAARKDGEDEQDSGSQKKNDSLPELPSGGDTTDTASAVVFRRSVARLMSFDGSSLRGHTGNDAADDPDDDGAPIPRKRGYTISTPSSSGSPDAVQQGAQCGGTPSKREAPAVGLNPAFVFLQLYHTGVLRGVDAPLLIPDSKDDEFSRAMKNFDRIPSYETHKVGIVYVGPGQTGDETAILSNVYGSERYASFLRRLGSLVRLRDCNPEHVFTGGLDTEAGSDGEYAYMWHDDIIQMIFHVATMMPRRENDTKCHSKKLHIGNDYVTIVYNDSAEPYTLGTIKGNFNYVSIVIQPLDHVSNAVSVQTMGDITDIVGQTDTKIISDSNLALLVKEIALHSSMASLILVQMKKTPQDPYASNWLERLRQLKRIRKKILDRSTADRSHSGGNRQRDEGIDMHDFTDYI